MARKKLFAAEGGELTVHESRLLFGDWRMEIRAGALKVSFALAGNELRDSQATVGDQRLTWSVYSDGVLSVTIALDRLVKEDESEIEQLLCLQFELRGSIWRMERLDEQGVPLGPPCWKGALPS